MSLVIVSLLCSCLARAASVYLTGGIWYDGGSSSPCFWEEGKVYNAFIQFQYPTDANWEKKIHIAIPGRGTRFVKDLVIVCHLDFNTDCSPSNLSSDANVYCTCVAIRDGLVDIFFRYIAFEKFSERELWFRTPGLDYFDGKFGVLPFIYKKIEATYQFNSGLQVDDLKENQTVSGFKPKSSATIQICLRYLVTYAMVEFELRVNGKLMDIRQRVQTENATCVMHQFKTAPSGRSTVVHFQYQETANCIRFGSYLIYVISKENFYIS